MKRTLLFGFLIFVFASCQQSKKYEYIEIVTNKSSYSDIERTEKEAIIIRAKTDSIAYLKAFQRFCITEKVYSDFEEAYSDFEEAYGTGISKPTEFRLIDEQGNNIAVLMTFDKIDSLKTSIRSQIFAKKNSMKEIADAREEKIKNLQKSIKIDNAKIRELEPYFNVEKDEFDPNGVVWYTPKMAPNYINENGIYCYFQSSNDIPSNLRLRLQYHSDDWLFFRKVQFSIDGNAYEYVPQDTETDSGNGGKIWEWFDESLGKSNTELLNALANAKSAKMKLIGNQYFDIKTITAIQIIDIKRTLDLYKAMGGEY